MDRVLFGDIVLVKRGSFYIWLIFEYDEIIKDINDVHAAFEFEIKLKAVLNKFLCFQYYRLIQSQTISVFSKNSHSHYQLQNSHVDHYLITNILILFIIEISEYTLTKKMLQSFISSQPFQYRPEDLYKSLLQAQKNTHNHFIKTSNTIHQVSDESLQVKKSPFATKCTSKFSCKCPFHNYHRQPQSFNRYTLNSRKNGAEMNCRIAERQFNRINQISRPYQIDSGINASGVKFQKKIMKTEGVETYDHISHRINCRNQEFEEFLKKNDLYILKQNPQAICNQKQTHFDKLIDSLENLQLNSQNINELIFNAPNTNISRPKNKKLTNGNNKIGNNKNTKPGHIKEKQVGRTITAQQLHQIKRLIGVLKSKKNNVKEEVINNLIKMLNKYAESQCKEYGITTIYKQIVNMIDQIQQLYRKSKQNHDQPHKQSKKISNKTIQPLKIKSRKLISEKSIQSNRNRKKRQKFSNQMIKNQIQRRGSLFKGQAKKNSMIKTVKFDSEENFKKYESEHKQNSTEITTEEIIKKKKQNRYSSMKNMLSFSSFRSSKYSKINLMKMETDFQTKQELTEKNPVNSEELRETIQLGGIKYSRFSLLQKQKEQLKQLRIKQRKQVEEHMRKKALEAAEEKQLMRKKYIQENRRFLNRMRKKLRQQYDLGIFIIEDTDSLITQKKKIRYLKEMLMKAQNSPDNKSEGYEEIAKYIEVYTQHCNLVMGRDLLAKENQCIPYDCDEQVQLGKLLQSKDVNGSLKFIILENNEKIDKQDKVDGWVAIPQYTTTYENQSLKRKRTIKTEENKIEKEAVENNDQEKDDTSIISNDDSLKQKALNQEVQIDSTVEDHRFYSVLVNNINQQKRKAAKKPLKFEDKLKNFRDKVLRKKKGYEFQMKGERIDLN